MSKQTETRNSDLKGSHADVATIEIEKAIQK